MFGFGTIRIQCRHIDVSALHLVTRRGLLGEVFTPAVNEMEEEDDDWGTLKAPVEAVLMKLRRGSVWLPPGGNIPGGYVAGQPGLVALC